METVCVTVLEECARFMLFRVYTRTHTQTHTLYPHGLTYTARASLAHGTTAMQCTTIFPICNRKKLRTRMT